MLPIVDHARTVLKALILPPGGPLLLAILGALLVRWRPRASATLLVLGLGSLWLMSLPAVSHVLVRSTERYGGLDATRPTGAQAIVILGGGGQYRYSPEYGGPAARPELLAKLTYGAFLARRTGLPVLVTGWRIEAVAMRATLQRNFGIDARWVDSQAYDTFDNARNSARLLHTADVHRIILVTAAMHMWRASQEFSATGLQVVPAPVGVVTDSNAANPELPLLDYLPEALAFGDSCDAVYELAGQRVRELLAFTHLRRQNRIFSAPVPVPVPVAMRPGKGGGRLSEAAAQ